MPMKSAFIDDAIEDDRAIRDAIINCKCTADLLYFRIPQTEWTAAEAKKQIDSCIAWFQKYCIDLTFTEFAVDPTLEKQLLQNQKHPVSLQTLESDYHDTVQNIPNRAGAKESQCNTAEDQVEQIYAHIEKLQDLARQADKKAHKGKTTIPEPKDVITILFLDEWFNNTSEGGAGNRPFRVTANSQTALVIGMTRFDRKSLNMLTHEVLHALRKDGTNKNKKCFQDFVKTNKVVDQTAVAWSEHYGGKNKERAMNHIIRRNPFVREDLANNRVLTIREYLTIVNAGYVKCGPGCDGSGNHTASDSGQNE